MSRKRSPMAASRPAVGIARFESRRKVSHNAAPASMNESALSRDMRGQPGTTYVIWSRSSVQPPATNSPTVSDTKAANWANGWLESTRSEETMMSQTTPGK